ncbi:nucleotidyl transferase AbiEii/AbiGii toxin family protein [Gordonibacter urolithinfaciens]|uniref:nucleotidyl transferase AbiEii/AbiGii toxin family protein n=1 Tax=Gordonibacter urolithinfaciens TaxID=1335613 RepID=UPI003AAE2AFD
MYLHEDQDALEQSVRATTNALGLSEGYVLKDYYAVTMLREVTQRNPDLIFKGGTCLSKCYGIIQRFSEDVDLGIPYEHATEGMRKRIKKAVVESAEQLGLEIPNLGETRSRREYNRYEVDLPATDDMLIFETAVMTPASPYQERPIQTFIGQFASERSQGEFIGQYGLEQFTVKANSLDRTLVDKTFALCDYYLMGGHSIYRQSRHIYDLFKLLDHVHLDESLLSLFSKVRAQREPSERCPSAKSGVDLAMLLGEIALKDVYRNDYVNVTMPLLYESIPYESAVASIHRIEEFLSRQAPA